MKLKSMLGNLRRKLSPARPPKRLFPGLADSFERRLDLWRKYPVKAPTGARVGVLVTPWMSTAVPFFSLECALLLWSEGVDVAILWDRSNIFFNAATEYEGARIAKILQQLPAGLRIIDISAESPDGDIDPAHLDWLLYENSVRQLRGEEKAKDFLAENPHLREQVLLHARRVSSALRREAFDWVLIPGGVWAISGVFVHIAERQKISYSTYDSGPGELVLTHDGVAAHFGDFPEVFAEVLRRCESNPAERATVMQRAHVSLQKRMEGKDVYQLQLRPASTGQTPCYDIIVPLNFRSDTAALLRQKLFPSITEWLRSVLVWLETQPGVTLAIRQHPCERIPEFRGSDQWENLLAEFPSLGERVRLIRAEDVVNTYDLIAGTKVVLPFTSRVGIEASLLGKPVVLSAHAYYGTLPFVWNPGTAAEYFQLIRAALDGEISVSPQAREAATIAYCLAEECLLLGTPFTPIPTDCQKWVAIPPGEWWDREELQDVRAALVKRQHLPFLRYQRKIAHPA
jgi:hypothetical protein